MTPTSLESEKKRITTLIKEILDANSSELIQKLESANCQEWFAGLAFVLKSHEVPELTQQILNHPNCPLDILSLFCSLAPEQLEQTTAADRIQKIIAQNGEDHWKETVKAKFTQFSASELNYHGSAYLIYRNLVASQIDNLCYQMTECPADSRIMGYHHVAFELIIDLDTWLPAPPPILANHAIKRLCENGSKGDLAVFPRMVPNPTAEQLLRLAAGAKWQSRLYAASHSDCPDDALRTLSKDSSKKVAKAALTRLPLSAGPESQVTENTAEPSGKNLLAATLSQTINTKQLREIARSGCALSACAATLHSNSTIDVIHAADQRDLPEWAQLGIARYTDSKERIESLLKGASKFIRIALAANPVLTKQQALQLLGDDWCNAIIANRFIDDSEVLDSITEPEKWPEMLATLRNSDTKAKQLQTLFNKRGFGFEVVSRLMARHPNCPKIYYKRLAAYCPEDLKQNPTYALSLLESGKAITQPFRAESIYAQMENGSDSYEMAITDALNRYTDDNDLIRRIAGSAALNPNEANRLAITGDRHIHNRILRKETPGYSEFVYRLIATTGTPLQRKQLASLKLKRVYPQLLRELTSDKDSSVRQAASKQATKRGLAPAQQPDKTSLRTLGNKAARIDLAKSSSDPDILYMLSEDKVRDVRRALAKHQLELPFACLEKLLTDSDDHVVSSAVRILDRMMESATPPSRDQLQTAITQLIEKKDFSPGLKSWVLPYCDNAPLLESMLEQREIRRFARPQSGSHPLIFRTYLENQGKHGDNLWLLKLEEVPAEIIKQLVTDTQKTAKQLRHKIRYEGGISVSSLICLIKHHPTLIEQVSLREAVKQADKNSHINFADALKTEPSMQPFRDFQALLRDTKDQSLLQQLINQAEQTETV